LDETIGLSFIMSDPIVILLVGVVFIALSFALGRVYPPDRKW
jgi:hypothetical protein